MMSTLEDKTRKTKRINYQYNGGVLSERNGRGYCSNFLDTNNSCTHGENCKFTHAAYSNGFVRDDAKIFEDFMNKTPGLSFVKKNYPDNKVS